MTDPRQPVPATDGNRWAGIALTSSPSVSVLSHQDVLAELAGLRARLDSQPTIEQSKGILMRNYRVGPDAAFDLLRRWSSHTNRKLRSISEMLVTAAGQTADGGSAHADLIELIDRLNQGNLPSRSTSRHRIRRRDRTGPGVTGRVPG